MFTGGRGVPVVGQKNVRLRCIGCGSYYSVDPWMFSCPRCGGLLEVVYEKPVWEIRNKLYSVWRYASLLPPVSGGDIVTLGEGGTPLVKLKNTKSKVGLEVYGKFEGANPTGSFKDRGMSVAVSLARGYGIKKVLVASTGNTAASVAAYAARAGMKAYVLLPQGKVALGKLAQVVLHGANLIPVKGNFDDALSVAMKIANKKNGIYPLNSFNQYRLEGQKTLSFEVYEQLGRMPGTVIVPVGNAGNISAIWKGFKELKAAGVQGELPVMVGVQAEGASPLASMWKEGLDAPLFTDEPETIASAIRIGRPVNWPRAVKAVKESGGLFVSVNDDEIMSAYRFLAKREGLGVELASASSLAGLLKLVNNGHVLREPVVLVFTGHALKDPEAMVKDYSEPEAVNPWEVGNIVLDRE